MTMAQQGLPMKKKRLQPYISQDLHEQILRDCSKENFSAYCEELLRLGLAQKRGETIQTESLPVIRDMLQTELRKLASQIRIEIREDLEHDIIRTMKDLGRRSDDRLAALIVRTVRSSGIAQRMLYSLMAKLVNATFAQQMYEVAKEQAGKELAQKSGPGHGGREGE